MEPVFYVEHTDAHSRHEVDAGGVDILRRRARSPRVLILLATSALVTTMVAPTQAATDTPGGVTGRVIWADGTPAPAEVTLVDGAQREVASMRTKASGVFSFDDVAPGSYQLVVNDQTPRWESTCFANTRAAITVDPWQTAARHVIVHRAGVITGRITRGPQREPASRAKIVASDESGLSAEVRANGRGEFALCGLDRGKARVWAYDGGRRWVGPFKDVTLKRARFTNIKISLRKPAGAMVGFIHVDGQLRRRPIWVTAINRRTGQWWVVAVRRGELSLRGLAPGRYRLVLPAVGSYPGGSVNLRGKVTAGRSLAVRLWLDSAGVHG